MSQSWWDKHGDLMVQIFVAIGIMIAAWIFYWIVRTAINAFSRRRRLAETDPGAETRFRMIERLAAVAIFFIAAGVAFWYIDVKALNSLAVGMFASAGVAGVVLGFAAQTTVSNLVAGIVIAFAQPVRLGDTVDIEGEFGTVESIGLIYTSVRVWDNRRLVVPNKLLSDGAIRNYTLIDPRMPALVTLRLAYGADLGAVRELLLETARAHPLFMDPPAPSVQVIEADNLGVTVRLVAWCETQSEAWTLQIEVRESVLAKLPGVASPVGESLTKAVVTQNVQG